MKVLCIGPGAMAPRGWDPSDVIVDPQIPPGSAYVMDSDHWVMFDSRGQTVIDRDEHGQACFVTLPHGVES